MPATSPIPADLVNIALDALDAEVKLWRRVPWAPGHIRLMRYSEPMDVGPAEVSVEASIQCHDVPERMADDMIVRFAMEKALEAAIGAISVVPSLPKPRAKRKKPAKKAAKK
ncbi:hypothetical protein [Bradyrhizobium sp. DASA03007]|uniref:hypothetical protein n=1 Tax=unclassified Bradyrhizobium TaxID=2631580 RepID=UPI003F6F20DC